MPLDPKQQPPYYQPSAGGGSSYNLYIAKLTQASTANPTVTVLENTFSGTLVWTREDVGYYVATLTGAFPTAAKIYCVTSGVLGGSIQPSRDSADGLAIETYFGAAASDDLLTQTTIEIRVYP